MRKKMDNKGFSLVELIIVIAIMAVLIGVLAPQYLKYVEKSRKSADLDTLDTLISAVEIYSADPDNSVVAGTITIGADGKVTADNNVLPALKDAGLASSSADNNTTLATLKSTDYKKTGTITFSATGVTVTQSGSSLATDLGRAGT